MSSTTFVPRQTLITADWLNDIDNHVYGVKGFGAVGDGTTDDTTAIQAALDTGKSVYCPAGTYKITGTLHFSADGQVLYGDGKDGQTIITNTTNSSSLFTFSTGTGAVYRRRCGIHGINFVGNALTTEGIALRGIVDDGLTGDADKSCWMRDVRIEDVGAGFALRVSSWSNNFYNTEIWGCNKGLKLGAEANSIGFFGLYITNCTNEGIVLPASSGAPANINFYNTVVQYSGGTSYMIDLADGYGINFDGLYLENSTAPTAVIGLHTDVKGVMLRNVTHNTVSGTTNVPILLTSVKNVVVDGMNHLGGTMASFVQITGTLPLTEIGGLFVVAGTVTTAVDDQSTRKATVVHDGSAGRLGPTVVRALTTQNAQEWRDSATDVVQAFIRNGEMHFGPDTSTGPHIKRAGSSLELYQNTSLTSMRLDSMLLGASSVKIITCTGTPEGAVTADVGSLALRTNGGAGTTLYVKESGSGNTGWVAK